MKAAVRVSARPSVLDLLTAARDELDAIVGEGLAPDVADRLNSAAALIEEAMGKIEWGG